VYEVPSKPKVQVETAGNGFNLAPGGVIEAGGKVAGCIDNLTDASEVVGAVGVGGGFGAGDDLHALWEETFLHRFAADTAALLRDGEVVPEVTVVGGQLPVFGGCVPRRLGDTDAAGDAVVEEFAASFAFDFDGDEAVGGVPFVGGDGGVGYSGEEVSV